MAPPDGGSLGQREQRLIDRAFEAFGWRTGAGGGRARRRTRNPPPANVPAKSPLDQTFPIDEASC